MKKNFLRSVIAALVFSFAFTSLAACGNKNSDGANKPNKPVSDVAGHTVEGTLHDVNVNYDSPRKTAKRIIPSFLRPASAWRQNF